MRIGYDDAMTKAGIRLRVPVSAEVRRLTLLNQALTAELRKALDGQPRTANYHLATAWRLANMRPWFQVTWPFVAGLLLACTLCGAPTVWSALVEGFGRAFN